ncbi:golgi snap receptor complex member [Anaeramoeba flamelloides]|uniref:Golgi snap receptor complex member n=1 Tax=Anaeramoeba flamelloides TaxID=1746091 RepID=A0AAV7YMY4_9EUKA|nr:golgi snap receptor complex member [Anaeramoeba flamelloides]
MSLELDISNTNKVQSLKNQIQNLKNQLEIKISKFSKSALSDKHFDSDLDNLFVEEDLNKENLRLLNKPDIEENTNLSQEISFLIEQFEQAINTLELHSQTSESNELLYQIQRNQQILFSFQQEYQKNRNIIKEKKEKFDLFHGNTRNKDNNISTEIDRSTENLLRERASLVGSNKAIDQVLGQAGSVHDKTKQQGNSFKNIGSKMGSARNKFPTVNTVIQKIKSKKNRDNLILGIVVAICLIILVWYWWAKK